MAEDMTQTPIEGQEPQDTGSAETADTSLLGGTTVNNPDVGTEPSVDWRSLLGEYANDPNIQKFKDPKDLAKSYIEAQRLIGREKIPIPKDENELQEALRKLGVPEAPDKYPNFEDAVQVFGSEEDFKAFKEVAHAVGLLPQQFEALYNSMKEIIAQDEAVSLQQRQVMAQQAMAQLAQEFGDEVNTKLELARKVFGTLPPETQQKIVEAGLDVDPNFVKTLANLAEYYKEDTFVASSYSPADAKAELQAIMNNPNHPYFDNQHPEHEAAVKKVETLYKIIYGGK